MFQTLSVDMSRKKCLLPITLNGFFRFKSVILYNLATFYINYASTQNVPRCNDTGASGDKSAQKLFCSNLILRIMGFQSVLWSTESGLPRHVTQSQGIQTTNDVNFVSNHQYPLNPLCLVFAMRYNVSGSLVCNKSEDEKWYRVHPTTCSSREDAIMIPGLEAESGTFTVTNSSAVQWWLSRGIVNIINMLCTRGIHLSWENRGDAGNL